MSRPLPRRSIRGFWRRPIGDHEDTVRRGHLPRRQWSNISSVTSRSTNGTSGVATPSRSMVRRFVSSLLTALTISAGGCAWYFEDYVPVTEVDAGTLAEGVALRQWRLSSLFEVSHALLNEEEMRLIEASAPTRNRASAMKDERAFRKDLLAELGTPEARMTAESLASLDGRDESETSPDDHFMNFGAIFPKAKEPRKGAASVVYCGVVLRSNAERDVYLSIQVQSGGLKLWLNGEEIATANAGPRATFKELLFTRGRLRKGRNFLFAKVSRGGPSWGLAGTVLERSKAQRIAHENSQNILERTLIPVGGRLYFNRDLLAAWEGDRGQVSFVDDRDRIVKQTEIRVSRALAVETEGLAAGIYACRVTIGRFTFEQRILVGDPSLVIASQKRRLEALPKAIDESARLSLEALITRFEVMLLPGNDEGGSRRYYNKLVYTIAELETLLSDLELQNSAALRRSGLHIRGFRSVVDEQIQHYMVYMPKSLEGGERIPIAVLVPAPRTTNRPFLKSVAVAHFDQIERLIRHAEAHRIGVLWPNMRGGNDAGAPIGNKDLAETLEDLEKVYSLDRERVYLIGDCGGGVAALLLATRYPLLAAAVGMVSPIWDRRKAGHFVVPGASDAWVAANNPIEFLPSLRETPVLVLHGDRDEEAPLAESQEVARKAAQLGVQMELKVMRGGTHDYDPLDPYDDLFRFFSGRRRSGGAKVELYTRQLKYGSKDWLTIARIGRPFAPASIVLDKERVNELKVSHSDNVEEVLIDLSRLGWGRGQRIRVTDSTRTLFDGVPGEVVLRLGISQHPSAEQAIRKTATVEGPANHVFSDRFLLVEPTGGEGKERARARRGVAAFQGAWERDFFGRAPAKADRAVDAADVRDAHLVLLGSPDSNSYWRTIAEKLPVKVTPNGITLRGRTHLGEEVGLLMVYPNPRNPRRYILLLHMPASAELLPVENVAIQGWFDYLVWREMPGGKNPETLDAGTFDGDWH